MPRIAVWSLVALSLVVSAGCSEPVEPVVTPVEDSVTRDASARTITLTKGDSLSVGVDTEGNVDITLTVAAGKLDAGVYTTQDAAMLNTARAARNSLGEANTEVSCDVDAEGTIVSISYSVTLEHSE